MTSFQSIFYIFAALLLFYSAETLRSLRPQSSPLPSVDISFIKQRKRGRKGGVRVKHDRRKFRPFLPSVLTGNVRSLCNKIDELSSACKFNSDYRQASILALSETWLNKNKPTSPFEIEGFSFFRLDRNRLDKNNGGGVCTYINNKWCHPNNITIANTHADENIELLCLSLRPFYLPREFSNVVVINVYIPPTAKETVAKQIITNEIYERNSKTPDCVLILTGDFNHCNDLHIPGLHQYVTCNTRQNSKLDLFYCNIGNMSYRCYSRSPLGCSDHNMILMLPLYKPLYKRVKPTKKIVSIMDENACDTLRGCFESTNWDVFIESSENVEELNDCVCEYIKFCEDIVCRKKEIVFYSNNKPWMSKKLRCLLNEKKVLCVSCDRLSLKLKQKEIKAEIQSCKEKYKDKIERCFKSGNSRETWKGVKSMINYNEKKNELPPSLDINELNSFYNRFDSVTDVNKIERCKDMLASNIDDDDKFEFTDDDTKLVFSKLNVHKAPGPDGVKGKILKVCCNELCGIFTHIFNMSLLCTCIPAIWKTSKIIPVPKKTKVSCMNDLRPIALTSIIMKSFERLVLCKLNNEFRPKSDKFQFAYKHNCGVEDAILTFTNNIYKHLDTPKSYCRILFVDFSSAFNTIRPLILIQKMLSMNLNRLIVAWVLEFLTERQQFVQLKNDKSKLITTSTGAPQGCVLSPSLFTLYTNDCTSSTPFNVPLLKFADDTTLQGLIVDNDEIPYRNEIACFVQWCDRNSLQLNVNKTKEIIIDFRKKTNVIQPLEINGQIVEQVTNYKYLGVTIDNKLKWTAHSQNVRSKMLRRMYFLSKLYKYKVSKKLCTLFYKSVIESVLLFCLTCWGGNCQMLERGKLNKIIKKAKNYTNPIETFDDLYSKFCIQKLLHIHECKNHPLYSYIKPSCHSDRLISIITKSERHHKSFLPSAIRLYNSL